ncbi:MAG TPA: tetratricopeptide repeat protein [Candidatus Polarisedimenticolaceae bacterium]|nr:tetratricopeptide repeat protein [Candidatus Polarisedimenticolaceae bacterium]
MSTDRIAQLHEQASEHYLNGDYDGALQAWRDILRLEPSHEQALEGLRMASQFVAREQTAVTAASPEMEHELDEGLRVLDALAPAKSAPVVRDVERQADGIDFGDIGAVDSIPLGASDTAPEEGASDQPEGWDAKPGPAAAEESFGLAPASAPTLAQSAAAIELRRRVDDLLTEARAKADAGERDEALAILARLAILDEDNADAAALRAAIEQAGASALDRIEQEIIEGVAALESGRLDDAEARFRAALALAPDHREAQHYLEKVAERRGGATAPAEDLLGGGTDLLGEPPVQGEAAPAEEAVPNALDAAAKAAKTAKEPPVIKLAKASSVARPDPPVVSRAVRRGPSLPLIAAGGLGVVLVICGVIAYPMLRGEQPSKTPPPPPVKRPVAAAKAEPTATTAAAPGPHDSQERAKAVAAAVLRGRSLASSGDFGGAIIAYNQALTLEPGNAEAKAGLDAAAEQYKAVKADRDALESLKLAFRDGEYTSGLRLAYRLPPSVDKSFADTAKVIGWYDLAVVALRAGDCKEAAAHLDEALAIAPDDAPSKSLREFAIRYADATKDRAFLDRVEALAFRQLPAS